MQEIRRSGWRACGCAARRRRAYRSHHDPDAQRHGLRMDRPAGIPAFPVGGIGLRRGKRGGGDVADRAGLEHRLPAARPRHPRARPARDRAFPAWTCGRSSVSPDCPLPRVRIPASRARWRAAGPRSRPGSKAGPRTARPSTGRSSSAAPGRAPAASSSSRDSRGGSACGSGSGRAWRPRTGCGACGSRVSRRPAALLAPPALGASHMCSRGTCALSRLRLCTARPCCCGSAEATPVRSAGWLAQRYPGPQAVIARSFSDRCSRD